ncbi:hypothetical protein DMUE_4550 [Dictyocoela muelleri]|nr:hypothetical protein DMUE_4550 [Dictyocoela muelleri]
MSSKKRISNEDRERVAEKVDDARNVKKIADALSIPHQTVSRLVKRYLETGMILYKSRCGHELSKLTDVLKHQVREWIEEAGTHTLKNLQNMIEIKFDLDV